MASFGTPESCPSCGSATIAGDRFCRQCGVDLSAGQPGESSRKTVVVVFIDLIGSTSMAEWLDPEPLRALMDRYYRVCTQSIVAHGGVVEKFIGDAIMAVFGMPLAHEDDALRAVRAATEAVAAVRALGAELSATHGVSLDVHCGVFGGEVIATTMPSGDLRVVGDAVNTAARLQSAAGPGEVLIGRSVALLVRPFVELVAVPPLALKGKAEPVPAFLVGPARPEPDTRPPARLIGRDEELDQLRRAYGRAVRNRECCVVTLLGGPGLGKSRLIREFLAERDHTSIQDSAAAVVTGHCQSYGQGITYHPIGEMIASYPGGWPALDLELTRREDGPRVAAVLRAATGHGPTDRSVGGIEEISWAVRTLFEVLATDRPLIVVCDDLHWAEPTLLDLIDEVGASLIHLPVLLICAARPELLEVRPMWGGGRTCATTMELGALLAEEIDELIREHLSDTDVEAHLVDDALLRVADASGGNPLYAELMLDMVLDGDDMTVPPTVHALLSARIDRLAPAERMGLSKAATIGREFSLDRLDALYDGSGLADDLPGMIRQLQRRRLVERTETPGQYRFGQALARDVAYAMTPKSLRRSWHRRLADWLSETRAFDDATGGTGAERYELAFHLEAACLLGREIDPGNPEHRQTALRAAGELAAAGSQALARKDLPAAAGLLDRARALMPFDDPRHRVLAIRSCDAWLGLGGQEKALAVLESSQPAFDLDLRGRRTRQLQRQLLAVRFGTAIEEDLVADGERRAAELADDPDDDLGWCRLHQLQTLSWLAAGQVGRAESAMREAIRRAAAMGDRYEEDHLLSGFCELAQWSPAPITVGLELCAHLSVRFADDRALLVPVMVTRSRLLALTGALEPARGLLAEAAGHAHDLQLTVAQIAVGQVRGVVESLAGRPDLAEHAFREAARDLFAVGQPVPARTLQLYAARERFRAGLAMDETWRAAYPDEPGLELRGLELRGLELRGLELRGLELRAQTTHAVLRARLLARQAQTGAAQQAAATALALIGRTDDPCLQGDVLFETAQLWRELGRADAAREAALAARDRYDRRGAAVLVERVDAWLAG